MGWSNHSDWDLDWTELVQHLLLGTSQGNQNRGPIWTTLTTVFLFRFGGEFFRKELDSGKREQSYMCMTREHN